ncbi:MAG: type 1 glutamine amidotransferase domain-containing protein [Roseovarius sp.]
MTRLDSKKVAILATHGFEQSELEHPLGALREAGAEVHVVSPESGEITGWQGSNWGQPVPVDKRLEEADPESYDALVLPGGQINPDLLRVNEQAVGFVKAFWNAGKPIGAICHAPWLLVEADVVKGRKLTSYGSIKTDVINAGGRWEDSETVTDQGLVTSRNPDDLPAFSAKMIEEVAEGRHQRRAA